MLLRHLNAILRLLRYVFQTCWFCFSPIVGFSVDDKISLRFPSWQCFKVEIRGAKKAKPYVCVRVGVHVCVYVCAYVSTYVYIYEGMYAGTHARTYARTRNVCVCVCVCGRLSPSADADLL